MQKTQRELPVQSCLISCQLLSKETSADLTTFSTLEKSLRLFHSSAVKTLQGAVWNTSFRNCLQTAVVPAKLAISLAPPEG